MFYTFLKDCFGSGPWLEGCVACIPEAIGKIVTMVYSAITIAAPLLLVIVGMFDMAKAITAQKEDKIKEAQKSLVSKAIAAVSIFLLTTIMTWMLTLLGNSSGNSQNESNVLNCLSNLLSFKEKSYNENEEGNPNLLCKNAGYKGAIKIANSTGEITAYTCYIPVSQKCDESFDGASNGQEFKLGDGNNYCLIFDNNADTGFITGNKEPLNTPPVQDGNVCSSQCQAFGFNEGTSANNNCYCYNR